MAARSPAHHQMRRPLVPAALLLAAGLAALVAVARSAPAFGAPGCWGGAVWRRSAHQSAGSLTSSGGAGVSGRGRTEMWQQGPAGTDTLLAENILGDLDLSGLQGKALEPGKRYPTLRETRQVIPQHCYNRDTSRALKHAVLDVAMTLGCGLVGYMLIPFKLWAIPLWMAYALVTGTVATGAWVVAHECGHGAFSDNKTLQDAVGFLLHTSLLVPYFSWQRSHAVHHRYTNHMTLGETHVPDTNVSRRGKFSNALRNLCIKVFGKRIGSGYWGLNQILAHLITGWPAYLLFGETGGHARGVTNHFVHFRLDGKPNEEPLFPDRWRPKVYQSGVGVLAMIGLLFAAGCTWGFQRVLALYVAPLMVTNAWLVLYTWLQHTDTDVPHFEHDDHSFMKGAFHTIDRPYNKMLWGVVDWLHHRIGTTHVVHHIDCTIPFYHAREATEAVRKAFPDVYLYDDTPVPTALWRVGKNCTTVRKHEDMWVWA